MLPGWRELVRDRTGFPAQHECRLLLGACPQGTRGGGSLPTSSGASTMTSHQQAIAYEAPVGLALRSSSNAGSSTPASAPEAKRSRAQAVASRQDTQQQLDVWRSLFAERLAA